MRKVLKFSLSVFLFLGSLSTVFAEEGDFIITGVPTVSLAAIISFLVKAFFTVSALVAFYHLLMGAFQWINSGGDKDAIENARNRIQAAVIGLILVFAVLAIAVTLEQYVFKENICFGISCPIKIPKLLEPSSGDG